MPAHDAYLRLTPYERLLPDRAFAERHFEAIRDAVEAHPEAVDDPGAFAMLEATRRALAELRDPERGSEDAGHTHALLLFHAWHLAEAGLPHLLVTVPVSRWAVEGTCGSADVATSDVADPAGSAAAPVPDGPATSEALPDAAYLQLPQHLFWIREDAADRPVSLDGFFRTVRSDTLHLLGVGGLHGTGSEGFRVLPLPGVPLADADIWLAETMREDGEDFRSEMPGAELEGLYELRTAGELLKLAARIERFVRRFPDGREAGVRSDTSAAEDPTPASGGPDHASAGGAPDYTRLVLT